jgi:chromate reductase, NAD(P)H dehydrogenase (quinone)
MTSTRTATEYPATRPRKPTTILGLCGSLRTRSYNRGLLLAAQDLMPESTHLAIADLAGVPEFNEDLEAMACPPRVAEIKAHVAAADVLLFAVPEYNYSLPGWFKNVLDWVSRPAASTPLKHKPAGLLTASAGERGGARAQLALRQSLVYTDTYVMARPEMFVGKAADKYDGAGRLVDPATQQELARYVRALLEWSQLLSGPPCTL